MNKFSTSVNGSKQIAYLVRRFPELSETFVVREINALRQQGWTVSIYPLWATTPAQIQTEAQPLLEVVRWRHPLSISALAANVRMFLQHPWLYLHAIGSILHELPQQPKRTLKSLVGFPIMIWIAEDLHHRGFRHVHAHFASHATFAALLAHRLTGIPYSFTGHAYDIFVAPYLLQEKIAEARFVVTISEFNRRFLQNVATPVKTPLYVVYCGIKVPGQMNAASVPGTRPPIILCVGRLETKKGQRYLIDACRILHERGVSFECRLIGTGADRAALQGQIDAAGLADRVKLLGARVYEEIERELQAATLFALPSVVDDDGNVDGIPVALMEAMAAGVPVVSTTVSGIPELIEDGRTGRLVPSGDAEALALTIAELLGDPAERDRLRTAAYEHVRTRFNIDITSAQLADLFSEGLAGVTGQAPVEEPVVQQ